MTFQYSTKYFQKERFKSGSFEHFHITPPPHTNTHIFMCLYVCEYFFIYPYMHVNKCILYLSIHLL